jgi:DNA-binding PadR family transcriptional regulator
VLKRLEEKGLVTSDMSAPTAERGGRRKRVFLLTAYGKKALEEANEMRNQLFKQIPKVALRFNTV